MIGSLFRGMTRRDLLLFAFVAVLYIGTAYVQSWNTVLGMVNLALISAIMALGVNMQWGYAGLLNVGVMGFVALGGLAAVLVSVPPPTRLSRLAACRLSSHCCWGLRP